LNILFIGNITSFHDLKWASFFADKANYKIYFLPSSPCKKFNINKFLVLKPLPNFSIIKFYKIIKGIYLLKKNIKKYKIDVVHISFATPNAFWGLFLPTKFVIATHGSDILIVMPNLLKTKGIRKFYNIILWKLLRKSFEKASAITCASDLLKREICKIVSNKNKIHIVRSGVNIEAIDEANTDISYLIKSNKKIIFSSRYVNAVYDTFIQAKAIALLPDNIINEYIFVFIRPTISDYSKMVENYLENIKLVKPAFEYVFLPRMSQSEMFSVLKKSSLVIMTPISDGTPSSALEAMAAKKPLIISDLNYDEEIFKETCMRFTRRTPEELANLIVTALENYPLDMINNAYEKVIKYGNIKTEMNKLEHIYKSVWYKN